MAKDKRKKILFAAVDIGWRIEHYTKFIEKNFSDQLHAESFVKYYVPSNQYKTDYTYKYNFSKKNKLYGWVISVYFFTLSLFKYDVFHFFSGETILTRKLRGFELKTYRLLGKKIIMHFVGSDIRSPKYIDWKSKNIKAFLTGEISHTLTEPFQDDLISDALKYADEIIVSTPDLLEIIPTATYIPIFIDIAKTTTELNKHSQSKNDEIVILHAPSNERLKGSKYIYDTLEKILSNPKYNVKVLTPKTDGKSTYSVTRYELFELMKKSDIIIDQMIIGWYGLQAVEGVLAQAHVISYTDNKLNSYIKKDCPIIQANVLTLESTIIDYINKPIDQNKSIKWVGEFHNIESYKSILSHLWLNK